MARALLVWALLSLSIQSLARPPLYDAIVHPELKACDQQYFAGDRAAATRCYANLLQSNAPPQIQAEAAWALGDRQTANRLFQLASDRQTNNPDILVRWGELYADTHQNAEAMEIFREALTIDTAHAFAAIGAASVLSASFDGSAVAYVDSVIQNPEAPPGAQLRAYMLRTRSALDRGDFVDAKAALSLAEEIALQQQFNPFAIRALAAAIAQRENGKADEAIQLALAANTASGLAYIEIAHSLEMIRFYRAAIAALRQAIAIEPELAAAHESLGVNLMRVNEIAAAQHHLSKAYELDPFSPVTVNTLRLLDSYDRFSVVTDPGQDGQVDLILRLRNDEADALRPFVTSLAREAIVEFSARYDFTPAEPIVIEMYPDHDDFAVRTAGMPGLGILGVAFGYLVALDSPSGRPVREFQWGTTLWHELAHVFTLSATEHRVPRWYSEGISVFEEWHSGPNPGIRIPPNVFEAIAAGRLLPIAELDGGFIRPSYPNQVIVSYMQAGLICQYLFDKYGEQSLSDLLQAFADRRSTVAAIRHVLDVSADEFDEAFFTWVDDRHGHTYEAIDNWRGLLGSGAKALAEDDFLGAIIAARTAIDLYPGYIEADSAWLIMARAEQGRDDIEAALDVYQQWVDRGGYDPAALEEYANLLRAHGKNQRASEVLAQINWVAPLDADLHIKQGEWLLDDGDSAAALEAFSVAAALAPFDKARLLYLQASAHANLGQTGEATELLFQALEIAPRYRDAQKLLVSLSSETN